nr:hypothetical protein [Tanacetum cinerariifolium]
MVEEAVTALMRGTFSSLVHTGGPQQVPDQREQSYQPVNLHNHNHKDVHTEGYVRLMLLKGSKENTRCVSAAGEELTAAK